MKNTPTPLSNIRILLDHTSHPGNIGSAARALKTMGLQHLHLIEPRRFPHAEADALACDAKDILQNAQVHATLDEALAGCVFAAGLTARKRHMGHTCVDVREAAQRLIQIAATQEVALLFGNEAYGLSNDELGKCQLMISIPTDEAYTSLNVASAVQIMTYELRMAWLNAPAPAAAPVELLRDVHTLLGLTLFTISRPGKSFPPSPLHAGERDAFDDAAAEDHEDNEHRQHAEHRAGHQLPVIGARSQGTYPVNNSPHRDFTGCRPNLSRGYVP